MRPPTQPWWKQFESPVFLEAGAEQKERRFFLSWSLAARALGDLGGIAPGREGETDAASRLAKAPFPG